MARITFAGLLEIPNLQSKSLKLLRGGADRIDIVLANQGLNGVTYTIRDTPFWQTRLDSIMATIPTAETQLWSALGAADFFPMHDGLYTNQGVRGGNGAVISGALGNSNPFFTSESNATYQQHSNGYFRVVASGVYCTYDGPWTIGMWIYPTLVTSLTPLWDELNAAATHYLQVFLDTDRRVGFRMSNGVTTFSVKDAAGPQIPLNQWSLLICKYQSPNFSYTIAPNSTSALTSVGVGGMATFVDANATYVGLIGSTNGYFGSPFTMNNPTYNGQTTAPLSPAMIDYLFYEWQGANSGAIIPTDSASLAGGAAFVKSYGKGAPNPLPPVTIVVIASNGVGDTRVYVRFTMERDDQ